jgi:hypothetical protein
MRNLVIAGLLVLAGASRLSAQIPTTFVNLQVMAPDTPQPELVAMMRGFALGLGVRCNYCHVGENPTTFEGYDFAADTKPVKQTARGMMRMVREINTRLLPAARPGATVTVTCTTCHRGQAVPKT